MDALFWILMVALAVTSVAALTFMAIGADDRRKVVEQQAEIEKLRSEVQQARSEVYKDGSGEWVLGLKGILLITQGLKNSGVGSSQGVNLVCKFLAAWRNIPGRQRIQLETLIEEHSQGAPSEEPSE